MSSFYDPMFYICSEKMPFTISIETILKDEVDPEALSYAANRAIKRYPYFAVQVKEEGGEYVTVPNDRPIVVYSAEKVLPPTRFQSAMSDSWGWAAWNII